LARALNSENSLKPAEAHMKCNGLRYHGAKAMLSDKMIIGPPKATPGYTVEDLQKLNLVWVNAIEDQSTVSTSWIGPTEYQYANDPEVLALASLILSSIVQARHIKKLNEKEEERTAGIRGGALDGLDELEQSGVMSNGKALPIHVCWAVH
jgi:hypothetical protein